MVLSTSLVSSRLVSSFSCLASHVPCQVAKVRNYLPYLNFDSNEMSSSNYFELFLSNSISFLD